MLGRAIAVIALLVCLSGCNTVVSVDPWFSEADSQGLPTFREGLWVSGEDDCAVDASEPLETWPECAGATLIRGGKWFGVQWDTTDDVRTFVGWQPLPATIANGAPLIVQMHLDEKVMGAPPEDSPWRYFYVGLRPAEFDQASNVVAYDSWVVQCGPKPPVLGTGTSDDPYSDIPGVTETPFPGLKVIDDVCVAEGVDFLRQAAALSEQLGERTKARWVRAEP